MKLLIIIFFKIVFAICWIILAYGLVDRVIFLYKTLSKREEPVSFSEQFFTNTELPPKKFDREAELLKIMEDAERNREKHQIVLWLGLDGLRLNDDGTTEWISRRKKETEQEKTGKFIPQFPLLPTPVPFPPYPVYQPMYHPNPYFQYQPYSPAYNPINYTQFQYANTATMINASICESMRNINGEIIRTIDGNSQN